MFKPVQFLTVLVLALTLFASILTACDDNPKSGTVTSTGQIKIVEVTRVVTVVGTEIVTQTPARPAISQTAAPIPTVTAANFATQTAPVISKVVSEKELIGQGGQYRGLKVEVTGADRYTEIKGKDRTVKPRDVFVVVQFDLDNSTGTAPVIVFPASLIDNKGDSFSGSKETDAYFILALEEPYKSKYKSDLLVKPLQPGMRGKDFLVFEVPADATNFILKI